MDDAVDIDALALFSMHKECIDDQCSIHNNQVKFPPGLSSDFVQLTGGPACSLSPEKGAPRSAMLNGVRRPRHIV